MGTLIDILLLLSIIGLVITNKRLGQSIKIQELRIDVLRKTLGLYQYDAEIEAQFKKDMKKIGVKGYE